MCSSDLVDRPEQHRRHHPSELCLRNGHSRRAGTVVLDRCGGAWRLCKLPCRSELLSAITHELSSQLNPKGAHGCAPLSFCLTAWRDQSAYFKGSSALARNATDFAVIIRRMLCKSGAFTEVDITEFIKTFRGFSHEEMAFDPCPGCDSPAVLGL